MPSSDRTRDILKAIGFGDEMDDEMGDEIGDELDDDILIVVQNLTETSD